MRQLTAAFFNQFDGVTLIRPWLHCAVFYTLTHDSSVLRQCVTCEKIDQFILQKNKNLIVNLIYDLACVRFCNIPRLWIMTLLLIDVCTAELICGKSVMATVLVTSGNKNIIASCAQLYRPHVGFNYIHALLFSGLALEVYNCQPSADVGRMLAVIALLWHITIMPACGLCDLDFYVTLKLVCTRKGQLSCPFRAFCFRVMGIQIDIVVDRQTDRRTDRQTATRAFVDEACVKH